MARYNIANAIKNLSLKDEVITSVYLDDFVLSSDLSNYLDKNTGGDISGNIFISNTTKSRQLNVERPTQQLNNTYTTDAYIACGSKLDIGFKYFPINYITADSYNSIISVNCQNQELRDRVVDEAIDLEYSIDSENGGINVGKVLDVILYDDYVVGLSVDNVKINNSTLGIYFINNPSLGLVLLNYTQDVGGLAVGYGCKVHCYGSVAEGNSTKAVGRYSHTEGYETIADWGCHAEGRYNEAFGVANHVEGFSNQIDNRSAIPRNVHVEGIYNVASGEIYAAHIGGTCAKGKDSYSYTWNGTVGDVVDSDGIISAGSTVNRKLKLYTPLSPYSSHGEGTFNINPIGQEMGVWIGEKTLADIIEQHMQPIYDVFDSTFNGDIFLTINGRKYISADQPKYVFTYQDEDKVNLLSIIKLNSSYTSFGASALSGCSNLTNIDIPEGISSLGNYALRNCLKLSSVTLPNSLLNIGNNCFRQSHAITSIVIPNSISSIGQYGFGYMNGITTLSVPDSVTKLDNGAFGANYNLTSINYPSNVITGLTANVLLNDYKLKEISAYSFNCDQLSTYIQNWIGDTKNYEMSQVSVFGSDGTMIFDKTKTTNEYTFNFIMN